MKVFFWLAIIVMPLDSFPLFPIETVNRPLSVFFLIGYLTTLYIKRESISKIGIKYILTVSVILCVSVILWLNGFVEKSIIYKTLLHYFIVIIYGLSCIEFFKSSSFRYDEFDAGMRGVFLFLSLIIIPVSVIQLFGRLDIFPPSVVENITSLFSYRNVEDRIQGISGEAAQSFRFIFLFLIFYIAKLKINITVFIIYFLLLIFSGSTFSIILLLLTGLIYILLSVGSFFTLRNIFLVCVLGIIFVGSFQIFLKFSNDYTLSKIEIITQLLRNPSEAVILLEEFSDGSAFVRLVNPIIGFIIFWDSSFIGVGANSYHYYYYPIIEQYFPFAVNFSSVAAVGSAEEIITAKSMLSKVSAEFGLVGLLVVFVLFGKSYYILKTSVKYSDKYSFIKNKALFSYLIVLFCFTESYIYFPFFIVLSYFLISLPKLKDLQAINTMKNNPCF